MNIFRELTSETVLLDMKAETKKEAIEEMLDALVRVGKVAAARRDEALSALIERERRMSTGMEHGIAIPHAKTDAVPRLVAAVGRKVAGLDFESTDGQPSRFFIMTLSPISRTGPHLQFVAEVSRILNNREIQSRLLEARTPAEVLQIMRQK